MSDRVPRLSAVILARSVEERLPECLASVAFCDEVVVVVSAVTDRSAVVAAAAGARVFARPFDDFARQHEFARAQARGAWVFSIDADERATPALALEVRAAADAPEDPPGARPHAAYSMPFQNHFRDVWLRHGGFWPDRHVRLFLREKCRYDLERPVHEKLLIDGTVGQLRSPMLHFTYGSLGHCLAKTEAYAEAAALALFSRGRRAGPLDLLLRPLWRIARGYVLRGGFLDGSAGAVMAVARAYEVYARYARLWELGRFPAAGRDRLR